MMQDFNEQIKRYEDIVAYLKAHLPSTGVQKNIDKMEALLSAMRKAGYDIFPFCMTKSANTFLLSSPDMTTPVQQRIKDLDGFAETYGNGQLSINMAALRDGYVSGKYDGESYLVFCDGKEVGQFENEQDAWKLFRSLYKHNKGNLFVEDAFLKDDLNLEATALSC